MYWTRGSRDAYSATICGVESVEQLSVTRISKSVNVCASSESSVKRMYFCPLYTGTPIETRGVALRLKRSCGPCGEQNARPVPTRAYLTDGFSGSPHHRS